MPNWNYTMFDPLRTAGEYTQGYTNAADKWAEYQRLSNAPSVNAPQYTFNGTTSTMGQGGVFEVMPNVTKTQVGRGVQSTNENPNGWYTDNNDPIVPDNPGMPNEAAYLDNLRRLQYGQQVQQGNYNKMMGGGFAGGVLPDNMMQTYQSGGQFGADSRGIRPTNPFAQSPSYGPEQAMSASYGRQGGLGGLGGFGTTEVFNV